MCKSSEKAVGKLSMSGGLKRLIMHPTLFCTQAGIALRRFSTTMYAQFYTAKMTLLPLFEQWLYPSSTGLITIIIIK